LEVKMTQMVRKQIYIKKRQKAQLQRAAKTHGMSEAELIRQAIDQRLAGGTKGLPRDPEAWQRALALMRSLQAQGPLPNRSRKWTRDELYEERESRFERHSD
jgi:hypothetical protein